LAISETLIPIISAGALLLDWAVADRGRNDASA
jgi:hypothetical protein